MKAIPNRIPPTTKLIVKTDVSIIPIRTGSGAKIMEILKISEMNWLRKYARGKVIRIQNLTLPNLLE
jgi:hypothetical protein